MSHDFMSTVFSSFLAGASEKIGIIPFAVVMTLSFFSGLVLSWLYKTQEKWNPESRDFALSLVLFSVFFAVVTMVIGSNIARAFGLVGALSIIRFRNTVKSMRDILFIFWSLTIGMAVGSGYFVLSVVFLLMSSLMYLALVHFKKDRDYVNMNLSLTFEGAEYQRGKQQVERMLKEQKIPFSAQTNFYSHSNDTVRAYFSLKVPICSLGFPLAKSINDIKGVQIEQDSISGSDFGF